MRLFSRLGAWLRSPPSDSPGDAYDSLRLLDAGAPAHGVFDKRLPTTPPDRFKERLLQAVDSSLRVRRASVHRLDPAVQLLVIPSSYGPEPEDETRLAEDIDLAIREVQAEGRLLASLTWSALKDARPNFEPSYLDWAQPAPERFDGETGLIFFLDLDAIAQCMCEAATALGFSATPDDERPVIAVSDGTFRAHVGINALLAEALWTAHGPLGIIRRRARALPAEFRSFQSTFLGLKRRFPEVEIHVDGSELVLRGPALDGGSTRIDYRHIAASTRASGVGVDAYLARARLDDLVGLAGDPGVLVRSPAYLKAWPDALAEVDDGFVRVAVRHDDGRVRPVLRADDDPAERFAHYADEARRQRPFHRFVGHAFVVDDERAVRAERPRVTCFVGDGAASLTIDAGLVRGAIEGMMPVPARVRVCTMAEDVLVVADVDAPGALVDDALKLARKLETDLHEDRSDRVTFDVEMDLPPFAAGNFELTLTDDGYFELCDESEAAAISRPGHAHMLRGLSLQAIGRLEQAIPHFERAVRAGRDDGETHLALGRAHVSNNAPDRAIPFLERAKRTLPQSAEAANALGLARYGSGDPAAAALAFESAVRLDPEEPAFLVNLGRCYVDKERFGEARSTLDKALGLAPDSAEAHATMALLCHRTGDTGGARHHAREALAEHPDDTAMRSLLNLLEDDD